MNAPRAVVIVINYNTRNELKDCLDSLANCLDRVVVFDNRSTDGSADLVRQRYPRARLIESDVNLGYGTAANKAVALCPDAEIVIVSNSDVLFQPDSLDLMTRYLAEHPRVGILGPRLLNVDGSLQASCFPLPGSLDWMVDNDVASRLLGWVLPGFRKRSLRLWPHREEREVPWVKGAVLAIRKTAFDEVRGFDNTFFMYYEETDLCLRMARQGWGVWFAPVTEVAHLGGASTAKVRGAMARELFVSSMRFARIHYRRIHCLLLLGLWKGILLVRLCRDRWRLWRCTNAALKVNLQADVEVWKAALRWRFADLKTS